MAEIFKAHDYTVSLSDLCDYGNYVTLSITNVRMMASVDFYKRDTFRDIADKLERMAHALREEHRVLCIEAGIPDEEGSDAFGGDYAS